MFTGILWTLVVLETFIIGASQHTCKKKSHFQQSYCRNEKVFKVRLLDEQKQTGIYAVEIIKYYKGDDLDLNSSYSNRINVTTNINLLQRKDNTFVILGSGKNNIFVADSCGGVFQWNTLTAQQQWAFKAFYLADCDCLDSFPEYSNDTSCFWQYGFYAKYSGCLLSGGRPFQNCRIKRNQTRSIHRDHLDYFY